MWCTLLLSFINSLSVFVSLSSFVSLISPLRRIASHVSLVTIATLWGSQRLQGNAGKVSFVWGVQIVLTLLSETAVEDLAQKVLRVNERNIERKCIMRIKHEDNVIRCQLLRQEI